MWISKIEERVSEEGRERRERHTHAYRRKRDK